MAVGLAVGIFGALLLLPVMRNVRLAGPALYPIRVLAGAGIIYGARSGRRTAPASSLHSWPESSSVTQ